MIPVAEALKLARELLQAVRELTIELRSHRAHQQQTASLQRIADDAWRGQ